MILRSLGMARHYCCTAAIVTHTCDNLLLACMADDRLANDPEKYENLVKDEVKWCFNLGEHVWEMLASMVPGGRHDNARIS